MELIATDTDRNRILDYLGSVMVENAGQDRKTRDHMVQPAYRVFTGREAEAIGYGRRLQVDPAICFVSRLFRITVASLGYPCT